jgi:hypothetical protein
MRLINTSRYKQNNYDLNGIFIPVEWTALRLHIKSNNG